MLNIGLFWQFSNRQSVGGLHLLWWLVGVQRRCHQLNKHLDKGTLTCGCVTKFRRQVEFSESSYILLSLLCSFDVKIVTYLRLCWNKNYLLIGYPRRLIELYTIANWNQPLMSQCDQIWRNFDTLGMFNKSSTIFEGFSGFGKILNLLWQK